MTIPELFERVAAKVPEVRPKGLKYIEPSGWRVDYYGWVDADEYAYPLIEAACWRLLLCRDDGMDEIEDQLMYLAEQSSRKELTKALLLAVERVHGGNQ